MAYQKHNFQTGGTIEATPFNEMDDQIAANEAAVAGKYEKPSGGIPESDLAAAFVAKVTAAQEAAAAAQTAAAGKQNALPQVYLDHLEEQTYQKPEITFFAISPSAFTDPAEIGSTISVDSIGHYEAHTENIAGTLTLKHGSATIRADIAPHANFPATVNLSQAEAVTRTTAGTETLTLSGTDTKGNTFTKSVSKTFYVPKFTGTSASAFVSAADILTMTRAKDLQTSVTLADAGYIYFVTDGSISSVKSGGFEVPMEEPVNTVVSINGVSVTYHVYRTSAEIVAGTYSFAIS